MMFDREALNRISFSAGRGQDNFSMSRGSFKYRKKIFEKITFNIDKIDPDGDSSEIVFRAKNSGVIVVNSCS